MFYIAVDCGLPPNIANGQVSTSSGTFLNSIATYACDNGYSVTEEKTLVCGANGQWNGITPICIGKLRKFVADC